MGVRLCLYISYLYIELCIILINPVYSTTNINRKNSEISQRLFAFNIRSHRRYCFVE